MNENKTIVFRATSDIIIKAEFDGKGQLNVATSKEVIDNVIITGLRVVEISLQKDEWLAVWGDNSIRFKLLVNDVEITPISELAPPQPRYVEAWKFRASIYLHGLTQQVEAGLNTLPEPNRTMALTAWEYGNQFNRYSSVVESLKNLINLTDAEVDQLFDDAEKINL